MSEQWIPRPMINAMSLREFKMRIKRALPPDEVDDFLSTWKVSILARVPYGATSEFILLYRDEAERAIVAYRNHIAKMHNGRFSDSESAIAKEIASARAIHQAKLERDAADRKASAYLNLLVNAAKTDPSVVQTASPEIREVLEAMINKDSGTNNA